MSLNRREEIARTSAFRQGASPEEGAEAHRRGMTINQLQAEKERQARKEAEAKAQFEEYRRARKQAAKEGVELTGAKFKLRQDTGELRGRTRGIQAGSRDKAQQQFSQSGDPLGLSGDKGAIQQLRYEAFQRAQAKAQRRGGGVVDQAAINRETRQILAERNGRYSAVDREALMDLSRGRYDSMGITEYVDPMHNYQFGSEIIGDVVSQESAKGEKGLYGSRQVYDPADVKKFIGDYSYYLDVKRGKGAADDVIYTQVSGKPGIYEGVNSFGFVRTIGIAPPKYQTKYVEPKEEKIGLAEKPSEAFTDVFSNYYTGFIEPATSGIGVGMGALFGGDAKKLGKQAQDIGLQSEKKYRPTVEGTLEADITSFASKKVSGFDFGANKPKPSDSFVVGSESPSLFQTFSAFGGKLAKEKPESVAASLAASSILFLPDLITKGTRLATKVPGVVRTTTKQGYADLGPFRVYGSPRKLADDIDLWFNYGGRPEMKAFRQIQANRPESSIFKQWINYERKGELSDIERTFGLEPSTRSGAVSIDEVTITKEFSRAPFGRFVTERRPRLVGEKITAPLSIDEELGLVKLNPDKPVRPGTRSLPTLGELRPPDAPTPWKQTSFFREGTGSLGDPTKEIYNYLRKPGLEPLKKPSTDWIFKSETGAPFTSLAEYKQPLTRGMFRSSLAKPESIDWIFKSEGAPFSYVGSRKGYGPPLAPIAPRRPLTEDMFRSSLVKETSETERAKMLKEMGERDSIKALSERNLREAKDLMPRLFVRQPRKSKTLTDKEITDLFETLEGKKEIGFARDLLTREQQGKLAGDLTEDLFKPAKARRKSAEEKAVEDFLKQFRAEKATKDSGGIIEKESGKGHAIALISATKKRRRPDELMLEVPGESAPIPSGYAFPSMGAGRRKAAAPALIPNILSGFADAGTVRLVENNIKSLGAGTGSKPDFNALDTIKIDTKPFSASRSGLGLSSKSLFAQSRKARFEPTSARVTSFDLSSMFDLGTAQAKAFRFATATPSTPQPDIPAFDIPGLTPSRRTPTFRTPASPRPPKAADDLLGFGEPYKKRKRQSRRLKRTLVTSGIQDPLAAIFGPQTPVGKFANLMGNPEPYFRAGILGTKSRKRKGKRR